MINLAAYRGKKVAVFGLARTGLTAAKALLAAGAELWAWDDKTRPADLPLKNLYDADFAGLDALVLSPGVPLTHPAPHPLVLKARAAGVAVVGDVELFAQSRPAAPIAGITGTNGKSTTTALTGHIFAALGRPTEIGGNIGRGVLDLAELPAGGRYVLELSSFQLDLTHSLKPRAAVLLNVTPDHLDRHGDMEGYMAAKTRLFRNQGPGDFAVIGVDDEYGRALAASLNGPRIVPVSIDRAVDGGVYADNGVLWDATAGAPVKIGDMADCPALPGRHNGQNAAAAYAVARMLGEDPAAIFAAIASFPGLPHRLETVGIVAGVRWVNDSKATNADATSKALDSFDNIYWIAGGKAKSDGIDALGPWFGRIRKAYLIGEAAERFAGTLNGRAPYKVVETMQRAVAAAASDAGPGSVVLLSPACASFDQYKDFEARGDHFRDLVKGLSPSLSLPLLGEGLGRGAGDSKENGA